MHDDDPAPQYLKCSRLGIAGTTLQNRTNLQWSEEEDQKDQDPVCPVTNCSYRLPMASPG